MPHAGIIKYTFQFSSIIMEKNLLLYYLTGIPLVYLYFTVALQIIFVTQGFDLIATFIRTIFLVPIILIFVVAFIKNKLSKEKLNSIINILLIINILFILIQIMLNLPVLH